MREGTWGAHQSWLSLGSVISFDTLADGEAEISAIGWETGRGWGQWQPWPHKVSQQITFAMAMFGSVWFGLKRGYHCAGQSLELTVTQARLELGSFLCPSCECYKDTSATIPCSLSTPYVHPWYQALLQVLYTCCTPVHHQF